MKIRSSFFIWAVLVTTAGLFTLAGLSLIDVPGDGYLAALWLALSCYVGGDQVAAALKTRSLPAGTRFTGNRKK